MSLVPSCDSLLTPHPITEETKVLVPPLALNPQTNAPLSPTLAALLSPFLDQRTLLSVTATCKAARASFSVATLKVVRWKSSKPTPPEKLTGSATPRAPLTARARPSPRTAAATTPRNTTPRSRRRGSPQRSARSPQRSARSPRARRGSPRSRRRADASRNPPVLLPALDELASKKGPRMAATALAASAAARRAVAMGLKKPVPPPGRPGGRATRAANNRVTKAALAALAARRRAVVNSVLTLRFPTLTSLTIGRCTLVQVKDLCAVLPRCTSLGHLSIRWLSGDGVSSPAKTPTAKKPKAPKRAATAARRGLRGRVTRVATEEAKPGGDACCLVFGATVADMPALTSLDLSLNTMNTKGAAAVAAGVAACPNLVTLTLDRITTTSAGTASLLSSVAACPNLRVLYARHMHMGQNGARALADALPACEQLTALHLAGNGLALLSLRLLAGALPRLPNLADLYLGTNRCGDAGAEVLADTLFLCRNLATLDISKNLIGRRGGAKLLTAGIHHAHSLAYLFLADNPMGAASDDGAALKTAATKSSSLVHVDLTGCGFSDAALLEVEATVQRVRPAFTLAGVTFEEGLE